MIEKIEVTNFMSISHAEYELGKCSVISGRNELGKSTLLNAINWVLTDSLFTAKPGTGENDIDSITPNTFEKGDDNTEVSLKINGNFYTKIYKVGFDKETGRINKHSTEYKFNGIAVGTKEKFYADLYEELKFQPAFRTLKNSEPRLFTDPLYALLKLDGKELRALLVAMGCSVSNEELYAQGFEDMRPYFDRCKGKWDDLRKQVKKDLKDVESSVKNKKAELNGEIFKNLPEYDMSEREALEKAKSDLIIQKNAILNGTVNEKTAQVKDELANIKIYYEQEKNKILDKAKEAINNCNEKIKDYFLAVDKAKLEGTQALVMEQIKLEEIIKHNPTLISQIKEKRSILEHQLESTKQRGKQAFGRKTSLTMELAEIEQMQFVGMVTCPNCGKTFPADPADLEKFNADKAAKIEKQRTQIKEAMDEVKKLADEVNSLNKQIEETKPELTRLEVELQNAKASLENVTNKINSFEVNIQDPRPTLNAQIALEQSTIANVDNSQVLRNITNSIEELERKLKAVSLGDEAEVEKRNAEANTITSQILSINGRLDELAVLKQKIEDKTKIDTEYKALVQKQNEVEYLLTRINDFIQLMISLINEKAKELTGFEFVMLEDLLNGNVQEVCYPLIDGVPFFNINNAKKIEYGIKFIEKCRSIAHEKFGVELNEFPILADDLEKIDDEEKLTALTSEQLICTRVDKHYNIITILGGEE